MSLPDPLELVGSIAAERYRVESLISHGGLSLVYRVHDIEDGSPGALKCYVGLIDLPEPTSSVFRTTFKHVGRLIGYLSQSYSGLVRIRRTGAVRVSGGRDVPAMLLEWLDGVTLETLLDWERLEGIVTRTPTEVFELMREPMEALAAAHDHGIVHRDLKPSNIFVCGRRLDPAVPIKVLDFSLAKYGDRNSDGTITFLTPDYAAPEQFRGDERSIGPWTDVFALALILVELMLGGRPALVGEDLDALRRASEDRNRRPTPRARGLDVANGVEAVFKRALAVDPAARFPEIGSFTSALERAVSCGGRLTSTGISRVSGVLVYNHTTGELPDFADAPTTAIPMDPSPARGNTVVADHPWSASITPSSTPNVSGDTVVSPGPAQTGHTVLAPRPPGQKKG